MDFLFLLLLSLLLMFYKQLKTTTHHSYSRGQGAPKKAATWSRMGQGQLNLQELSCGKGEVGKLRLLVPTLRVPGSCPTSSNFRGVAGRASVSCPCCGSLCFVMCWFDYMPGFFPSLAHLPVSARWAWDGSCATLPVL